jgi:AcrR family transcriptional regulator
MSSQTLVKEPQLGAQAPLYPKLQPRPNGPGREEVARNQRARLYGAMIEGVAQRGYAATTVVELTTMAGVSKRTLYERFPSKEACFLATYDIVVRRAIKRINAAYRGERSWIAGLRSAFEAFAAEVVEEPKASKLAVVEALGAGPAALERMERTSLVFERMIASSFAQAPDGVALSPVVLKGIVGGLERVTRLRLHDGAVAQLRTCTEELLDWALSYRAPAAELLVTSLPVAPTPRPHPRTKEREHDEHVRILRTAAQIAARDGYAQLTAARIIHEAEVSDETFFQCYDGSERCFGAALDLLAAEALASVVRAARPAGDDWTEAVRLGLAGLLDHVAAHPEFGQVMFVEIFAAGPAAIDRRMQLMDSFADLLGTPVPSSQRPSQPVAEAIAGAIWGILHHHVVRGTTHRLPGLRDHAAYMVLAPLVGADAVLQR